MKIDTTFGLKILFVALMINYMVIAIILKDFFLFKYFRDFLLLLLLVRTLLIGQVKKIENFWLLVIFAFCVCISILRGVSINTGITAARRYLFPIAVYFVAYRVATKRTIERMTQFILPFLAILSGFGIFQAYVLKDEFLKSLGYPQVYLAAYGRNMLNQAYYFGNFGIQRVVATMSSPNILALIMGCTGIFFIINKTYLLRIKYWKFYMIILGLGYLLTVSRSNFVALGVVGMFFLYPRMRHKKRWIALVLIVLGVLIIVGNAQGTEGMVYKLWNWIYRSITFKESSAAGRFERWTSALQYVLKNPGGLGPGYVGSVATNAGKQNLYFDCENSYLCLALDSGWLACISYYLFYIITAFNCKRKSEYYKKNDSELSLMNRSATIMLLYIMVVMFFSNHVQDMEPVSFLFLYLGFIQGYTVRRKRGLCS